MADRSYEDLLSEITLLREENRFLKEGIKQGERIRKKITSLIDQLKYAKGEIEILARERTQILNSLEEMLFVVTPEGEIQITNSRCLALGGIEAEADLVGKMIGEWVIEEERNSLASFADFRLLIEQRKAEELRGYYRTKSGERIPILITGTEVLNGDGSPRAYVISARDVRDSKIMRTLRNSQSQLIKTAKLASLGELSAGIAHELNNPLMFVVGYNNRIKSALAKDDLPAREKILRYTEQIDEGADRMKTIIQSFLDFARQTETKREQMDVNSVIEKSINLVKEQLRLRSIRIKTELSNHPLLVMGEKVPLEQVMINFLTNARDAFSDIGDDIMKTVVVRTKEDDNRVMIEIEDNGVGIPSEIQDRMFDPFFTTKEPGKGTGLGMSITHKIIEDHGGKILLKSAPGEGARFTVVLPKPDVCDGGE